MTVANQNQNKVELPGRPRRAIKRSALAVSGSGSSMMLLLLLPNRQRATFIDKQFQPDEPIQQLIDRQLIA